MLAGLPNNVPIRMPAATDIVAAGRGPGLTERAAELDKNDSCPSKRTGGLVLRAIGDGELARRKPPDPRALPSGEPDTMEPAGGRCKEPPRGGSCIDPA